VGVFVPARKRGFLQLQPPPRKRIGGQWTIRLPLDGTSSTIPANAQMASGTQLADHVLGPGMVERAQFLLPYGAAYHFHVDHRPATSIMDTTQTGHRLTGDVELHIPYRTHFEVMLENMTANPLNGWVLVVGHYSDNEWEA
jgi:hypothetical protein